MRFLVSTCVKFLDGDGNTVAEHGLYDWVTAALPTSDTKVYETHVGMTSEMSKSPASRRVNLFISF